MKPKVIFMALAAFFITAAFSCLVAWCGGYDFDRRNIDVAFMLVMSTATSLLAGAAVIAFHNCK